MPTRHIPSVNDLNQSLCNIPEDKEIAYFKMLGHELEEGIDVDSARAISQFANAFDDLHIVDWFSTTPISTIRNDLDIYEAIPIDDDNVYLSASARRRDDEATAATSPPNHTLASAEDCNICASRPSHRLAPCHHTICYDHFLDYDDESNTTQICPHCSDPVTSTLELGEDNSPSPSDLLLLCRPLHLSPNRSTVWSSPTLPKTSLPSFEQRIFTTMAATNGDPTGDQEASEGAGRPSQKIVNPDAPAFVPRARAMTSQATSTSLNGASQVFEPAQKGTSRPTRVHQPIIARPAGAIQIGAHHPINYAQSAAGHAATLAAAQTVNASKAGAAHTTVTGQHSAPQSSSAVQNSTSMTRRGTPHPNGIMQNGNSQSVSTQNGTLLMNGPTSHPINAVQNSVSHSSNSPFPAQANDPLYPTSVVQNSAVPGRRVTIQGNTSCGVPHGGFQFNYFNQTGVQGPQAGGLQNGAVQYGMPQQGFGQNQQRTGQPQFTTAQQFALFQANLKQQAQLENTQANTANHAALFQAKLQQHAQSQNSQSTSGAMARPFAPLDAFHELSPARNRNHSNVVFTTDNARQSQRGDVVLRNPLYTQHQQMNGAPQQQNMNSQAQQTTIAPPMNTDTQTQQANMQNQIRMATPMSMNSNTMAAPSNAVMQPSRAIVPQNNAMQGFSIQQNNSYANNLFRPPQQTQNVNGNQMTNSNNTMPVANAMAISDDPFTTPGRAFRPQNAFNAAVGQSIWGPPYPHHQQTLSNLGVQRFGQQQPVANMGHQYPLQQQQPLGSMVSMNPQSQTEAARLASAIKGGSLEGARVLSSHSREKSQFSEMPLLPSKAMVIADPDPDPPFLAETANNVRPSFEMAIDSVPFVDPHGEAKASTFGVIKITNIPYNTKRCEVVAALGKHANIVSQPRGTPFYAVHIIMERPTAKTMDCFVELETPMDAQRTVDHFNYRLESSRAPLLGDRRVEIVLSSQEELMKQLFPRTKCCEWRGQTPVIYSTDEPFNSGFQGFVTSEEMVMVSKHAETPQRSPFATRCHNRTYESMVSTLHKYPWFAVDHITIYERALVFKAVVSLIRCLVMSINRPKSAQDNTAMLNTGLLQELCVAALSCPGLSAQQKCYITDFITGNGFGNLIINLPTAKLGIFGGWWPFEVLTKKTNASSELLAYYVSLLVESAAEVVSIPSNGTGILAHRAMVAANAKPARQSPFGDFEVNYPMTKKDMTLAGVALVEWNAVEIALKKVLIGNDQVLAITADATDGADGNGE